MRHAETFNFFLHFFLQSLRYPLTFKGKFLSRVPCRPSSLIERLFQRRDFFFPTIQRFERCISFSMQSQNILDAAMVFSFQAVDVSEPVL